MIEIMIYKETTYKIKIEKNINSIIIQKNHTMCIKL